MVLLRIRSFLMRVILGASGVFFSGSFLLQRKILGTFTTPIPNRFRTNLFRYLKKGFSFKLKHHLELSSFFLVRYPNNREDYSQGANGNLPTHEFSLLVFLISPRSPGLKTLGQRTIRTLTNKSRGSSTPATGSTRSSSRAKCVYRILNTGGGSTKKGPP